MIGLVVHTAKSDLTIPWHPNGCPAPPMQGQEKTAAHAVLGALYDVEPGSSAPSKLFPYHKGIALFPLNVVPLVAGAQDHQELSECICSQPECLKMVGWSGVAANS